jgi:hypothetical protein
MMTEFKLSTVPTYQEFSNRISVLDISDKTGSYKVRSHLDEFIAKNSRGDTRPQRLEHYKQTLYRILVTDRDKTLSAWYEKHGALPRPMEYYLSIPSTNILTDGVFNGRTNSAYGKLAKHLNFDVIYNTKKLNPNDSEYTFGLMRAMFNDFKIRNSMACPAFFDQICGYDGDSTKFWQAFMMGANRPSVFNPQTYKSILDEVFTGDTLLAPVMGWNSYQTAFYSSNFKHFIATDVIPSVVDNGNWLHTQQKTDKTVDLYCCPSEQWDLSKYHNTVDAILFSPPYYDLEIYDSPDQSFTNYPDYSTWLDLYWKATVAKCVEAMKPGAKFGFVISNYVKNGEMNTISEDMRDVVATMLTLDKQYRVQWSSMGGSRQSHKTRNGNYEDLWVFVK